MENESVINKGPAPILPDRVGRLSELAYNLWWGWHPRARELFRMLDYPLWRMSGHNPVKQLRDIAPDRLQAAADDPIFINLYDSVMSAFDGDMTDGESWFTARYPERLSGAIAFFSAEFAIHNSLPIYAGGLGVLAADICKEASDLGLPLVGVGLMYPHGYFRQHISPDGWQEEIFRQLHFDEAPINQVLSNNGTRPVAQVQLGNRSVSIGVWVARVGRVNLYLLDTDIEENAPGDRKLANRLYATERELRIQQEIILGVGGVRVLRALGIEPAIWHANEGHTAFMTLERVWEEVEKGATVAEATERVRVNTVFTTHTPLPAGHDIFPVQLVEKYFRSCWGLLKIDCEALLKLGREGSTDDQAFNMTTLALRMADRRNAVSQLHGEVARRMWHGLWPESQEAAVPISHITNGVHMPTWIAPELVQLYDKYLGLDWVKKRDDPELWQRVLDIPNDEFWTVRQTLKNKLTSIILERAQRCWTHSEPTAQQVTAMGGLLHPECLTIGFVRRFAAYKRPALIFRDLERLKRIVKDPWRPVQIVFAGKSHPADTQSKLLLQQVYTMASDPDFQGRIAFIEDYDMHVAHYLTQGVDVWLNTPRRLNEACGTSGMKAALNGVPHLSVRDGWWYEGYNGNNGWAIGNGSDVANPDAEDKTDAEALYRLLEEEIVPLYYDRDRSGVPNGWIGIAKEAIRSTVTIFGTRRMLKEYTERMYLKGA